MTNGGSSLAKELWGGSHFTSQVFRSFLSFIFEATNFLIFRWSVWTCFLSMLVYQLELALLSRVFFVHLVSRGTKRHLNKSITRSNFGEQWVKVYCGLTLVLIPKWLLSRAFIPKDCCKLHLHCYICLFVHSCLFFSLNEAKLYSLMSSGPKSLSLKWTFDVSVVIEL